MTPSTDAEPPFGTFVPNRAQAALIGVAQRSILRRGVFRRHIAALIGALGTKTLDVGFRGCSYRLRSSRDGIECGILLNPGYNTEDIDFLAAGLPPGGVFVDIGCNIGLYTLPLARHAGPQGRVLAVDANALVTGWLAFNAAASGIDTLALVTSAVSDRDGSGSLHSETGDFGMVSVDDSAPGPVPLRRLVDILDATGITRIDALKIDVEGHEDRALAPFLSSAESARRATSDIRPASRRWRPGAMRGWARPGATGSICAQPAPPRPGDKAAVRLHPPLRVHDPA